MIKCSAGLLLYRIDDEAGLCVLVAHPGGPFWARKDDGAWSVPKGEYVDGEDPHSVALREFEEELGSPAPARSGPDLELGEVKQAGGKRVTVWARQGDMDVSRTISNTFEMEWPPRSGITQQFPEVDRVEWFTVTEARDKLLSGQVPFLDRLLRALAAH